jgi:shikimate kinase
VEKRNNIFLIGFMGAGKSSLGKKLAKKMNFHFLDLDRQLEKENGESIPQIFENFGETYFRELEKKWLERFNEQGFVIALGGGTPCFYNNMELIHQKGISLYLSCPVPVLASRLQNAKTVRPLIESIKDDEILLNSFITKNLAERECYYNQADLIIEGANLNAKKIEELALDLAQKIYRL